MAEELGNFIVCVARYVAGLITYGLREVVNEVIAIAGWFASLLGLIIPGLNFEPVEIPPDTLAYINWVFPIGFLVPLYTSAFAAMAVYRIMKWWARRTRLPVRPL